MKNTLLLSAILVTITIFTSQAVMAKQDARQADKSVQNQQESIADIEAQAFTERRMIENEFQRDFALLQDFTEQEAERQAAHIPMSDRILWTEFIRTSLNKPFDEIYFQERAKRYLEVDFVYPETKRPRLLVAAIDSYFLQTTASFLMDDNARMLVESVANSNNQNAIMRNKARELLFIMNPIIDNYNLKYNLIQNRKSALLADLGQWEKKQKENSTAVIQNIETQPKPSQRGVVSAISYGGKNSFCMIDDEIVYEGSVIGNIRIAKIERYQVEFEKSAKKWIQKIGQPANSAWPSAI